MDDQGDRRLWDEYYILWILLAQATDAVGRARHRDLSRYGISNERRAVLFFIESNDGRATPVEISRGLFRELHSVTEMLKRMEQDGLVERRRVSGKSRVEVVLTERGREVFLQSLDNETDFRIFSALSKEERDNLAAALRKVRRKAIQDLGIPEWRVKLPFDRDEQGT